MKTTDMMSHKPLLTSLVLVALITVIQAQSKISSIDTIIGLTYSPPRDTPLYDSIKATRCMYVDVNERITLQYSSFLNSFRRVIPASLLPSGGINLIVNNVTSSTNDVNIVSKLYNAADNSINVIFSTPSYFTTPFQIALNLNYTTNLMQNTTTSNVMRFSDSFDYQVDRSTTTFYLPRNTSQPGITTDTIAATPTSYISSFDTQTVMFTRDNFSAPYTMEVTFPLQYFKCPSAFDPSKDPNWCWNPGQSAWTTCAEYKAYLSNALGVGLGLGLGLGIPFIGFIIFLIIRFWLYEKYCK